MSSNSKADFTVAIPAYNSEKTLPLVLEQLRSQTNIASITWEVIVVDNNSTDSTAQIVQDFQVNWLPHVPLRYCLESQQGSAYARLRAVKEANSDFVGFLDDDNLPALDWVAASYQFGQAHPRAGSFGGQIQGRFETPPPKGFEKAKTFLVIRNYANEPKRFEPEKLRLPPGAGLVVRKQAWCESVPDRFTRAHRGGHDYEISLHMHNKGWEIWYNPSMQIEHLIPSWRMERRYLVRIARIYGLCTCEIRLIIAQSWQKPLILIKSFLGSLKRIVSHLIRYQGRFRSDLGLACELSFLVGNLLSPFYYLWKRSTSVWTNLLNAMR
jgi:glycosyltransferase involved in cell wall biosynthesis